MKENKWIVWSLGIVLLGLWGAIGYQVVEAIYGVDADEERSNVSADGGKILEEIGVHHYRANVRDPFTFPGNAPGDSTRSKQTIPPAVPEPVPFTLSGILRDQKRKTAILETRDGSTFFLREGDTLRGVRIIKIGEQSVNYMFRKQTMVWHLER
jgi:hypothetical protein